MASEANVIAFFDVDETLIATKSMFDFVEYLDRRRGLIDAQAVIAVIRRLSWQGVGRARVNVAFWQNFAGMDRSVIQEAAREWADEKCRQAEPFFVPSGLARLRRHQDEGHHVALVSGSACDILEPLARHLAVPGLLATRLVAEAGLYSGEVLPPVMIGDGKRQAAAALAASRAVDLARCYAYGDHVSDLPLLDLVGHPHVIGRHGDLARFGRLRGWPVLPGPAETALSESVA